MLVKWVLIDTDNDLSSPKFDFSYFDYNCAVIGVFHVDVSHSSKSLFSILQNCIHTIVIDWLIDLLVDWLIDLVMY